MVKRRGDNDRSACLLQKDLGIAELRDLGTNGTSHWVDCCEWDNHIPIVHIENPKKEYKGAYDTCIAEINDIMRRQQSGVHKPFNIWDGFGLQIYGSHESTQRLASLARFGATWRLPLTEVL